MRIRILAAMLAVTATVTALSMLMPRDAHALNLHDAAGNGRPVLTRWAAEAKRNGVRLPAVDVTVLTRPAGPIAECGDDFARGCFDPSTFTIYMHRGDRIAFMHELGHAFDHASMSDAQRATFRRINGVFGVWDGGDYFARPSEYFANAYAACATAGAHVAVDDSGMFVGVGEGINYLATPTQHARNFRLIRYGY